MVVKYVLIRKFYKNSTSDSVDYEDSSLRQDASIPYPANVDNMVSSYQC